MGFLWTCYQVPVKPQQTEKVISVSTPEAKPVSLPKAPTFVGVPLVRLMDEKPLSPARTEPIQEISSFLPLPPPNHLIRLPQIGAVPAPLAIPVKPPAPRVPPVPSSLTVSSKLFVPDIPLLFDPMVLSEEEFDMFYPEPSSSSPSDADFFADFFVVGASSTIAYEDGLYYLGMYINGDYVGDIEVKFLSDTQSINTAELSLFINSYITRAASERLFGDKLPYLSIEEINGRGVEASYDSAAFTVSLNFGLEDMPERILSITAASINRREQYGMSGAIVLKPAKFASVSSLSLYTMYDYDSQFTSLNSRLTSLNVSNRLAFLGIGINFSFSLSNTNTTDTTSFTMGSWNGFYDFVESSQRLTFGNVGSSLNSSISGASSFGFELEKNYSYGTDRAKGNQFEYKIILVEPSEIVVTINGNESFRKSLSAGTYRLKDFVFTQGANVVKIAIIPDARPDDVIIQYADMGYDYRLLGKGDTLYGFGFTVPKLKTTTASGNISIPWLDNQYLSYYLDKYTATYWQQTGLTNTFTFSSDLAYSPGTFRGTVNGVLASMIGTSQLQLTFEFDDSYTSPSLAGALNHRFSGKSEIQLGTLNTGVNFFLPAGGTTSKASMGGTLSYSGNLTKEIRFTLSGSATHTFGTGTLAWNASFSSGFSPFKGMSINGTLSLTGPNTDPLNPTITGQITGSYSFSPKLNASASTSLQTDKTLSDLSSNSSIGLSYRPTSKDSFNVNLSGFNPEAPLNHSLVAGWSHSGELASYSLRQQVSGSYQRMTTTFTANTTLAFADGAFALAKSVNEAFFLVKPVGELKHAKISIARTLDSSPTALPKPLGSSLYNSISTNTKNTVVVFSTGATDYSTGASFVYEINPRSRQAFMAKIDIQPSFTISGLLFMKDKSPYQQYSSPVYSLSFNEAGEEVMTRDDALYLFTDQEGRFILSDVLPGNYLFDLKVEDLWYAVRFTVPEVEAGKSSVNRVLLLEDFWVSDPQFQQRVVVQDAFSGEQVEDESDVFGTSLVTGYDASVTLDVQKRLDEESFWKVIFPTFDQEPFAFDAIPQADEVNQDEFVFVEMGDAGQKTQVSPALPPKMPIQAGDDGARGSLVPPIPPYISVHVTAQVPGDESLSGLEASDGQVFPEIGENEPPAPSLSVAAP
ncbi:hypothetical protein [Sphaerochaeta sp. PS]|uniref:hypothetical protein n=1 Tax=Sphaerochaeta sp. PS TaxID=3076336 RepID=UPI0028A55DF0|nr:hypothetical protein [Sphaerochaeta sp. PS]MDT4762017.1 hypothetical protein [Sphaerochaeta sp. PS]